ncbi:MAG TPA: DUF6737 family protein [Halomicronema sp.]
MSKKNPYNPWDYKPWWCQPWSIILTSIIIISSSWFLFQRIWLTGLVAVPMLTWAGFFVLLWPKLQNYQEQNTNYPQTSENSNPPE